MSTARTIHDAVLSAARERPDAPFQRHRPDARRGTAREVVTYGQFADAVERLSRGLIHAGLEAGDRVGIVAENSARWLQADVAILRAGGADVPRGTQCGLDEVRTVLAHAGCRFAFVEDLATLARFASALEAVECVILLHGEPGEPGEEQATGARALTFDGLLALGDRDAVFPEVAVSDVATLMYTSGTTGEPKGVTLLHSNVMSNVDSLPDVLRAEPGEVFLALLPSWHMYERTVEYYAAIRGCVLSYTSQRRLREDLREERPH